MAGSDGYLLPVLVGCWDGFLLGVEMRAFMGTSGPWLAVGGEVMTEDFTVDGEIFVDHICNAEVINGVSHNANLIAAAPELLSALQAALEWIDAVPSDVVLPTMPGFDRDWVDQVIDKALGGSQ